MRTEIWIRRGAFAALVTALALGGLVVHAAEPEAQKQVAVDAEVVLEGAANSLPTDAVWVDRVKDAKPADFYIGLVCFPVDGALRAQLGLAENQGLRVDQVLPKGPGAKAGVQQFDVLITAGSTELSNIENLTDAVQKAGKANAELELGLVRAAKKQVLRIAPERRAGGDAMRFLTVVPDGGKILMGNSIVPLQVENMDLQHYGKFDVHVVRPPMVVAKVKAAVDGKLPKNLSISITRRGSEPAQLVVKRDELTWEISEKELDKLPQDVRGHVERMLGKGSDRASRMKLNPVELHFSAEPSPKKVHVELHKSPQGDAQQKDSQPTYVVRIPTAEDRLGRIEARLKAIQKELQKLGEQKK